MTFGAAIKTQATSGGEARRCGFFDTVWELVPRVRQSLDAKCAKFKRKVSQSEAVGWKHDDVGDWEDGCSG